jgi:hypothetical protein
MNRAGIVTFPANDLIFFRKGVKRGAEAPAPRRVWQLATHLLFATAILAVFSRVLQQLRHTE